jgi:signal transduction histidine kinase
MNDAARLAPVTPSHLRFLAPRLLVFALLALAGNVLGAGLRYPDVGLAVLFPPYAVLTAALIIARRRDWVWYVLIDALASLAAHWPDWPTSWAVIAGVANAARALTAAMLFTRFTGGRIRLDRVGSLGVSLLGAVLIAPAVGATLGAVTALLPVGTTTYWLSWRAWFISNALTGLTMLPLFLAVFEWVRHPFTRRMDRTRLLELGGFLIALLLSVACALIETSGHGRVPLVIYAIVPVLLWGALRFGAAGASAALTTLTLTVMWRIHRGTVILFTGTPDERIVDLQLFVLFTSLPVLCLAALESAREHAARLHRVLLASRQDRLAIIDADGFVLEVSDSWRRVGERRDTRPVHRIRPGEHYETACQRSVEDGDSIALSLRTGLSRVLSQQNRRVEIEYDESHNGKREAILMRIEALERPVGGAIVICTDITARVQTELELEDQRRQLSHLSRVAVLGQLSGAFAHELNQPLAAILSNAEAGARFLKRDTVDLKSIAAIFRDIVADDHRAAAVIARLRALLKRGDRSFDDIDVRELIDEVVTLARAELITRQVQPVVRVDPATPAIRGDKVQLHQVLLNLILNACDAMATQPVADRSLELNVGVVDDTLHVRVRDRGTGFAPDVLDRLFEPFLTTKSDGLGLGLSISRTIVAAHGGRLWGENNPEGGATLHCMLPVAPAAGIDSHSGSVSVFVNDRA